MGTESDLIARLEAATEGSRELDVEIGLAVDWRDCEGESLREFWTTPSLHSGREPKLWGKFRDLPHYTTSIDDALRLVPEGWGWYLDSDCGDGRAGADLTQINEPCGETYGTCATPALALCAAILRARV